MHRGAAGHEHHARQPSDPYFSHHDLLPESAPDTFAAMIFALRCSTGNFTRFIAVPLIGDGSPTRHDITSRRSTVPVARRGRRAGSSVGATLLLNGHTS